MSEPSERDPELTEPTTLPADFEVFFTQEQKRFLAYARSRLRSHHDAEEAVLEAGHRMYAKWERILAHANPPALAYRILRNVVADYWRRLARRDHELPVAEPPDTAHLQELRSHEDLDLALDRLEAAAPLQAQCVRLWHLVGLSYEQISERLNTTPGAAKTSVSLGVQRLKEIMNSPTEGEGES